jgi:hypothetical protein
VDDVQQQRPGDPVGDAVGIEAPSVGLCKRLESCSGRMCRHVAHSSARSRALLGL